jgi:tripartite ATP-independent transporter DctM subunit
VEQFLLAALLLIVLFFMLGMGVWVGFSLLIVGWAAMFIYTGKDVVQIGEILASNVWGASYSWALAALPLFIWMGEILFRSRLSEDMFDGLSPWLSRLPGGLLHINIIGCGVFAAVSGSSAATAATIGKMSLPELKRLGYDEKMSIGTLAGSGTLGLLIPPSIVLIVYGVATEQSIARLFIAGVLPGIMLIVLFMGYVMIWSFFNRDKMPAYKSDLSFFQKLYQTRRLIPVVALITCVLGSIYGGFASPTDAAAVGVFFSLVLSWFYGVLNWKFFIDTLMGAVKTSCMIAFILAGAAFLTIAMGFTGLPRVLASWIGSLGLSPYMLLLALTVFFIIMGCFLDGASIVVLTAAVIIPMVEQAGIDLIWFGIFLVIVVEMAQITPPVGFNLFVIQGLTIHDIIYTARASLPFFMVLVLGVVLVILFPEIVTYLPSHMM